MSMAPGWYPDQADGQYEHYWDGGSWRERRLRPGNGEAPVPGSPYAQAESWAPSKQSALDATARPWDQAARDAPSHPWMEASSEDSSASGTLARPDYAELTRSRVAGNAGSAQNLAIGIFLMVLPSWFVSASGILFDGFLINVPLVVKVPFILFPLVFFLSGLVLVVRWAIHHY
ncbi:MAG: DUF2510 domain-containing protein [Actinomycetaceae bacterium]|nr:DUF2510 domain-containing protein [Actinomycetaceae bacterium]